MCCLSNGGGAHCIACCSSWCRLVWILRETVQAITKAEFHQISNGMKLVMLTGILSMVFFKSIYNMNGKRIILASQSPRRKQLLEWAEIPFEVIVQETPETYPARLPLSMCLFTLPGKKALAVQEKLPNGRIIIAADTVVVLAITIIGKPKDREACDGDIHPFVGQQAQVITGVVTGRARRKLLLPIPRKYGFTRLHGEQIEFYVDKYNLTTRPALMPSRNG